MLTRGVDATAGAEQRAELDAGAGHAAAGRTGHVHHLAWAAGAEARPRGAEAAGRARGVHLHT
eukprot:255964-Prorocentrum_minimum.AAC.1